MNDNEACFFTEFKYEGTRHCYQPGADVDLYPGDLDDRFKSVQVGAHVTVLAWQHSTSTGRYREWSVDQPDITDIGGLSRFTVVPDSTLPIAARFTDHTGAATGRHTLQLSSHQVGAVKIEAGTEDALLVGIMPAGGPAVTTALYVRDEYSGAYVALGSICFGWNAGTRMIDVADRANLPAQLECRRAGRNEFVFALTQT